MSTPDAALLAPQADAERHENLNRQATLLHRRANQHNWSVEEETELGALRLGNKHPVCADAERYRIINDGREVASFATAHYVVARDYAQQMRRGYKPEFARLVRLVATKDEEVQF